MQQRLKIQSLKYRLFIDKAVMICFIVLRKINVLNELFKSFEWAKKYFEKFNQIAKNILTTIYWQFSTNLKISLIEKFCVFAIDQNSNEKYFVDMKNIYRQTYQQNFLNEKDNIIHTFSDFSFVAVFVNWIKSTWQSLQIWIMKRYNNDYTDKNKIISNWKVKIWSN